MIAGLLHDVGLIARSYFEPNLMSILVTKYRNQMEFYQAEISESFQTHDLIGNEIAKKWNLNERICYLIEHHHQPDKVTDRDIDLDLRKSLDILHLADTLSHRLNFSFAGYVRNTHVSQIILDRLNLKKEDVINAANEAKNVISSLIF
jgi:HD-like signal output (HDOD) protein